KDVFAYVIAHKEIFLKVAEVFAVGKLAGLAGGGKGGSLASNMIGGAAGGAGLAYATNTFKDTSPFFESMENVRIGFGAVVGAMDLTRRTVSVINNMDRYDVMSRAHMLPYAPGHVDKPDEKGNADKPVKAPANMNVAVHIEQTINTNDDPDRLLIATTKAIED